LVDYWDSPKYYKTFLNLWWAHIMPIWPTITQLIAYSDDVRYIEILAVQVFDLLEFISLPPKLEKTNYELIWVCDFIYLFYFIIIFIIFKIVNTQKNCFLKLYFDGLENLKKTSVTQTCIVIWILYKSVAILGTFFCLFMIACTG